MPNPRGKLPGDPGNTDWDSLLSGLDPKDEPPAERSPIPGSPRTTASEAPPSLRGAPLYKPPTPPTSSRPTPPEDIEDLEEERTVIGVISADLIQEAARGAGGLGQFFGKPEASPRRSELDAIDISFDEPGTPNASSPSDDDGGVMTSAPALHVSDPDPHNRITPVPDPPPSADIRLNLDSLVEFPDPFASSPKPASKSTSKPAKSLSREELPTLPAVGETSEQDEPTRVGKILPGDLDIEALRAEFRQSAPSPRASSSEPAPTPPTPAVVPASRPTPAAPTPPPPASRPTPAKSPPRKFGVKIDPVSSSPSTESAKEIPEAPASIESPPLSLGQNAIPATVPTGTFPEERDSLAFLAETDRLQEWVDRATWMEAEARALEDKSRRARALLVVSELLAMSGEEERAQSLAEEVRELAPTLPLAHRQVRARAIRERDVDGALPTLEIEAKSSGTAAGRAHAAIFAAELLRQVNRDSDGAFKKLDQAARLFPSDPRPHLLRAAVDLGKAATPSRYRWPEEPSLTALVAATRTLNALRGVFDKEPTSSAAEAIPRIRAALSTGDLQSAAETLASLGNTESIGNAALWLASLLAAPQAATRAKALRWSSAISDPEETVRRRLAFWSFESGDTERTAEALSAEGVFSLAERTAARALMGAETSLLETQLQLLASEEETLPLASALASSMGITNPSEVGSISIRSASSLGRGLAAGGNTARTAILAAVEQSPDDVVARTLLLDAHVSVKNGTSVAATLATWPQNEDAPAEADRDRALAAAITYALSNNNAEALKELERAQSTDPTLEATGRVMAALDSNLAVPQLDQLVEHVEDNPHRSLLLLESAVRQGASSAMHGPLLRLAHETAPELPLAAMLGLEAARRNSDTEGVLTWLRARIEVDRNPTDLLREALALQSNQPEQAAERIAEALQANEGDMVLRELAEQLAPERADSSWRAHRAPKAPPPGSALLAYRAALALELSSDTTAAAELGRLASETGGGALSQLLQDRCDASGANVPRIAEALMAIAKEPPNAIAEREAYERLADLDAHGRNDSAAASQWHRALLEQAPGWLPSLRYLEHRDISEGNEEDLESTLTLLAQTLQGPDASAHAQVAARLRMRTQSWESTRDLAEIAMRQVPPSVWALRQFQAHARASQDPAALLKVSLGLAARTSHPGEKAALLLRAAQTAQQNNDPSTAISHLREVLKLVPEHLVALSLLAELLEKQGEAAEAAEMFAAAAKTCHQPQYQAPLWYQAALLWLDKTEQQERGVEALEAAAACDINQGDTFDRLRKILVERGEGAKLAALLQRRLETEESPERRIELEVALGRALTQLGDRQAAKQALAAALDSSPDHVEALRAFVDLCAAEEDWESAEQSLLRLGRLLVVPEEQAQHYLRLGDIYRLHLPNPERAETAYQEVLKRDAASAAARERLVKLYASQGNTERALEIQSELLATASDPAEKRQRTMDLAQIHEETLQDLKKAEQILDGLRKEFPQDPQVLRALAEFHLRHDHSQAANVLLDRTAADARRALATGRFEIHFFANLATVFELRGNTEAAATANGTVAALGGQLCDVQGLGLQGAREDLEDLLAPEVFTPAFRTLVRRSAEILDAASVVDLKSLRAAPLPPSAEPILHRIQHLAQAFGLSNLQVFAAPTLAAACLPIALSPPTIVLSAGLLSEQNEGIRTFLVLRALTCLQVGISVFCRTAPIDLWPMTAAFLQLHSPAWSPQGVDANKFRDFKGRFQKVAPSAIPPDLAALAAEVTGTIGNRASTLQTLANSWGSRTALLITGDVTTALDAIAWAAGQTAGAPQGNPDRIKWIGRNMEARDLIVFSVSDNYSEARSR